MKRYLSSSQCTVKTSIAMCHCIPTKPHVGARKQQRRAEATTQVRDAEGIVALARVVRAIAELEPQLFLRQITTPKEEQSFRQAADLPSSRDMAIRALVVRNTFFKEKEQLSNEHTRFAGLNTNFMKMRCLIMTLHSLRHALSENTAKKCR